MEHLIVFAVNKSGKPLVTDADVLVDGEVNGKVGNQMQLDEGFVEISIDTPGAETKEVELRGTSPRKPMRIKVKVCPK